MATLMTRLALSDGMSAVLTRISGRAAGVSAAMDRLGTRMERTASAMQPVGSISERISSQLSRLGPLAGSTFGQFTLASVAAAAVMKLGEEIAAIPGKLMDTAEAYAKTQARIKLLTKNQQEAAEMNELIYQSALRSRGSFEGMADAVAKIGMTAKEAFPDPREVVPFVEEIQKLFAIGGTGIQQQADAMLQLTQALGSGKLMGDEFRSIAEAAPLIEKMVAKTMGVSQGALKELSSQGEITAEIIKRSMFENMDEINAMFATIPMTFSQHMQTLGTVAYYAFRPVFDAINDFFNDPEIIGVFGIIAQGIIGLAGIINDVVLETINTTKWLVSTVRQNIGIISTVLITLGAVLGALAIRSAVTGAIGVASSLSYAAANAVMTGAMLASIIAQEGLNAALYACPLTWIIGLVVLLAAAFYGAVQVVNYFAGTSLSAAGIIAAIFTWLFTHIVNLVKFCANRFIMLANFLGSVFQNPLYAIFNLFNDIWNGIVKLVASAVNSIIDLINMIPGIDPVGHVTAPTVARHEIPDAAFHIDEFEYGDATYNAGKAYDFAAGDWGISNPFDRMGTAMEMPGIPKPGAAAGDDKNGKQTAGNTGRTAANTGRMLDSLELMEEEIKSMKDYAEQEAINKYTTASVTIEMGGVSNNISSNMDIDGVTDAMAASLFEKMASGAEMVHV